VVRKNRQGQSTLEYMLYISVIVVASVALAWIAFGVRFDDGFDDMSKDVETVFSNAQAPGSSNTR